jgi:glutaredoxin
MGVRAIHIVYATWCPHCVPITVEPFRKRAEDLGIPCLLHDIDSDDAEVADDLVRRYGDWSPDYLVPQVFLEDQDGAFAHILTGDPRGLSYTREAVEKALSSPVLAFDATGIGPAPN